MPIFIFSQYFFNRFCPLEKCGITPHCLCCDSLTLKSALIIEESNRRREGWKEEGEEVLCSVKGKGYRHRMSEAQGHYQPFRSTPRKRRIL